MVTDSMIHTAAESATGQPVYRLQPRTTDVATLRLALGRYSIGSDETCDFVVPVDGVAAQHCLLLVGPRKVVVKAISPLTWLNDGVVRESSFGVGDRLIIGPVEYRLEELSHEELHTPEPVAPSSTSVPVSASPGYSPTNLDEVIRALRSIDTLATSEPPKLVSPEVSAERARLERIERAEQALQLREQRLDHTQSLQDARQAALDERQSEITTRLGTISSDLQRLREERRQLDALRNEQAAHETQLREQRQACATADAELQSRERLIVEREKAALAQATVLQTRAAELEQRAEVVQHAEQRLAELQQTLSDQTEEWERQSTSRLELEAMCVRRQSELADVTAQLTQAREELESIERSNRGRASELEIREAALQQQLDELQSREQALHDVRQQVEAAREQHVAAQRLFEEQSSTQQAEAAAEVLAQAGRAAELETLQSTLDELATRHAAEQQRLEQLALELSQRALELDQRTAELSQQAEQVADVAQLRLECDTAQSDLRRAHQELLEQQTQLAAQQREADEREQQIVVQRLALDEQRATLQLEREDLESLQQELVASEQSLITNSGHESPLFMDMQSRLDAAVDRVAELEEIVEKLSLQAEQQDDELGYAQDRLALRESELTQWEEQLTEREWQLQNQPESGSDLPPVEVALPDLHQKLETDRTAIEVERLQLQEKQRELDRKLQDVDEARRWFLDAQASLESDRAALDAERDAMLAVRHGQSTSFPIEADRSDELESDGLQRDMRDSDVLALRTLAGESSEDPADDSNDDHDSHVVRLSVPRDDGDLYVDPVTEEFSAPEWEDSPSTGAAIVELAAEDEFEVADASVAVEFQDDELDESGSTAAAAHPPESSLKSLREQLAEMFGLSTSEKPARPAEESDPLVSDHESGNAEQIDENSAPEAVSVVEDEPDSVAAYMERLLARTRQPGSSSAAAVNRILPPAETPKESAKVTAEVAPILATQQEIDEFPSEVESEQPSKKLRVEDKEAMRANLDSFRELANYSARSAVAKSQAERLRTSLKLFGYLSSAAWVGTSMLLVASRWMGQSQLFIGCVVGVCAIGLSLRSLLLWLEIKKHEVEIPATFEDVQLAELEE